MHGKCTAGERQTSKSCVCSRSKVIVRRLPLIRNSASGEPAVEPTLQQSSSNVRGGQQHQKLLRRRQLLQHAFVATAAAIALRPGEVSSRFVSYMLLQAVVLSMLIVNGTPQDSLLKLI
jgi:hypothetical protein